MFRRAAAIAAILFICAQGSTAPARAALTLAPTCTIDDLKAAIVISNVSPGVDTILLATGCTYTLTTVDNVEFGGDNGLPLIEDSVIIEGDDSIIERSSAGGTPEFRILRSPSSDLTIRGVTIRNGTISADTPRGGGVSVGANLTVENSYIIENSISGVVDAQGGGLFASTSLTVSNSVLSSNSATTQFGTAQGGGAMTFGQLTVTNSGVFANSATSGNLAAGGGTSSAGASSISDSDYESNRAEGAGAGASGGGAYSLLGMDVVASDFIDNAATATGTGLGQGIAVGGGSRAEGMLLVYASTYDDNLASGKLGAQGGGSYSGGASQVTISSYFNNTASSGTGAGEGGGAYSLDALTFTNSTASGNEATGPGVVSAGGGTFSVQTTTISNATIVSNIASGSQDARGGGSFVVNNMVMINSIVAFNTNGDCTAFGGTTASLHNIDGDGSCADATSGNPGLLPLALNAPGFTKTHALADGSPAIGLGSICQPEDQRGILRPQGSECDVGAYERSEMPFDVDCDADEDSVDIIAILRLLAGLDYSPMPQAPCDADVNGDQVVNMLDVLHGRNHLAGLLP